MAIWFMLILTLIPFLSGGIGGSTERDPEGRPSCSVKKPKILFVMLEFPRWNDACKWGFGANIGMIPGFIGNGVEYFVLPALFRYGPDYRSWIDYAREILGDTKFDQVWFEVVHSPIPPDLFDFLVSLAPVRLGFVFESLELLPEEWANNPEGCRRREETIQGRLSVLTHMVNTDETDALRLDGKHGLAARAIPPGFVIPREFICHEPPPPLVNFGVFFGTLYGERRKWVESPYLKAVLRYCDKSPEFDSPYPAAFDDLHNQMQQIFAGGVLEPDTLDAYLEGSRLIRTECFKLWLEGLRIGAAVVNLPQWGRAYASRIIEGMAAGRPVISQRMENMENRPLARNAFEDGKEILLYQTEEELAEHLSRVLGDPDFARAITINARKRIESEHTTEGYVGELLKWIENG